MSVKLRAMLLAKLCVSFERGVKANKPEDFNLDAEAATETKSGAVVRGLGTSYVLPIDLVREREAEERRIRDAFKAAFPSGVFPGTYLVPSPDAADLLLAELDVREDVTARSATYEFAAATSLPEGELLEWAEKIQNQLKTVRGLGRGPTASVDGLRTLAALANCPVIAEETATELRGLIESAKLEQINRVELKRKLDVFTVKMDLGEPVRVRRRSLPTPAQEEVA